MPERQQQERELKAAFIQHLPERILSIANDWDRLAHGAWDERLLRKLCQRLQNLTGDSGSFGLINLSESSFSLEVYLGGFRDCGAPPSDEQQATVNTLIAAIRHESELIRGTNGDAHNVNLLVYLLAGNPPPTPALTGMLEQRGCTTLAFNDPDDVEGELQRRLPDALILDDGFLPRLARLNHELAIQQERQHKHVPLICLSRSRDLEQRLRALRSGVDAYYMTPIDTRDLCDRVVELASPKTDRFRILIVEDDRSQAEFAASILNKSGMKSRVITDPLKVIDTLDEFRPDLILMDLYMPSANGIELTTIIREHPDFVTTPVVFLSGEQNMDKQLHALSVGADDFLSKPIRPRHLINTITNRVRRARILEKRHAPTGSRDRLSGLHTRRYLYEQLDRLMARPQDHHLAGAILHVAWHPRAEPVASGHESDTRLAKMGNLISGVLEEQDIAARLNADSVAVLVQRPHRKNIISLAGKLAHKLCEANAEAKPVAHIGVALLDPQLSAAELLANAAYACAELGESRRQVKLFEEIDRSAPHSPADQPRRLLEQALQQGNFPLYFRTLEHPGKPGVAQAYELKPRLRLADGRPLGSLELLSLADEEGLGARFSQWLIERALNVLEEKRSEGFSGSLFVLQSAETIFEKSTAGWLRDRLRARQMVGSGLVLEYRIAGLSLDLKRARQHFSDLQEMGVKVSLARFGANPTTLKVQQYLKADYVRLAGPVLAAEKEVADGIVKQLHDTGAQVVLPAMAGGDNIAPYWPEFADLAPLATGPQSPDRPAAGITP